MMENLFDYKSPLYGRRTGQLTLKEFPFVEILGYFNDLELTVKYYSVYGVTPTHILEINKTNKITFYERKWKELNEYDGYNILRKLKEKAKSFEWHENRIERYGIIAKKINNKEELKGDYLLYDLFDFKNIRYSNYYFNRYTELSERTFI